MGTITGIVVIVVIVVILLLIIIGVVTAVLVYGYRNPTSTLGQAMIKVLSCMNMTNEIYHSHQRGPIILHLPPTPALICTDFLLTSKNLERPFLCLSLR